MCFTNTNSIWNTPLNLWLKRNHRNGVTSIKYRSDQVDRGGRFLEWNLLGSRDDWQPIRCRRRLSRCFDPSTRSSPELRRSWSVSICEYGHFHDPLARLPEMVQVTRLMYSEPLNVNQRRSVISATASIAVYLACVIRHNTRIWFHSNCRKSLPAADSQEVINF